MKRAPAAVAVLLAAPLLVLFAALDPPDARAACDPVNPGNGETVICTDTTTTGFRTSSNRVQVRLKDQALVTNQGNAVVVGKRGLVRVREGATLANGSGGFETAGVLGAERLEVENDGFISVSGTRLIGVYQESGNNGGKLTNTGIIDSSAGTGIGGAGVEVQQDYTIINRKKGGILASGTSATAVDVGSDSLVDNRGTISATGASAVAIRLRGSGARVENSGTVEGGSDLQSAAVRTEGNGGGRLRNLSGGLIDGAGGLAVVGGSGDDVVDNRGELRGRVELGAGKDVFEQGADGQLGASTGTDGSLLTGADKDRVDNAGSISGDVDLGTGNDRYVQRGGGSVGGTLSGGSGSDVVELAGSSDSGFQLDSVVGFERLTIQSDGERGISGQGSYTDGTKLKAGTLALDGEVELGGPYTQKSGSSLAIVLDPEGTSDKLVASGTARLEGGELLLSSRSPLDDGDPITVIEADRIVGRFDSDPVDTGVLDFSIDYGTTEVVVSFERSDYADVAVTDSQQRVASILDAQADDATGDFDDVLASLDFLSADQLRDAYDDLDPEYYDAHTSTALELGRLFTATLLRPPPVCRGELQTLDGGVRRPCGPEELEPWVVGYGAFSDRDAVGGNIGFDTAGGGLAIGVNQTFRPGSTPDQRLDVSFAIGASRSHVDVDHRGNGSVTTADFGFSGAWSLAGVVLRGAASYGHVWNDARRGLDLGTASRSADGDYQANRISAALEAAYVFDVDRFSFEPYVGADYTWMHEESFHESGAGSVNLDLKSRDTSLWAGTVGLRARALFETSANDAADFDPGDTVWLPELRFGYRRVFSDEDRTVEGRFEGVSDSKIRIEAEDAEEGIEGGVGLTFQPYDGATVGVHYDARYGDRTVAHFVRAEVRVPLPLAAD